MYGKLSNTLLRLLLLGFINILIMFVQEEKKIRSFDLSVLKIYMLVEKLGLTDHTHSKECIKTF